MLTTIFYIFTICGVISALAGLAIGCAPWRRVRTKEEGLIDPSEIEDPKLVSVIVHGHKDETMLDNFLQEIYQQDYPNFEVIVVSESTAEATAMLAEKYASYSNLYFTFIPEGSHNLSRRKLIVTLGMKAAKGEVALLTASNASIHSTNWITQMAAPFMTQGSAIEIALGVAHMNYSELHGAARWYREFDMVCDTASWLAYALNDDTYRGDGYNLALRRRAFFDHKGFARTINLENGDDDLFVHEVANHSNTAVVYNDAAMLTMNWGHSAARIYKVRKENYAFTSRWLPKAPFRRQSWLHDSQWCTSAAFLIAIIAAVIMPVWYALDENALYRNAQSFLDLNDMGAPSPWLALLPAALLIAWQITQIYIYRGAAKALGATRLWWALPPFLLWHPIGNSIFKMRHHHLRHKNYTWQRRKH